MRGSVITKLAEKHTRTIGYDAVHGFEDPMTLIVKECGRERNDSTPFGCFKDASDRWNSAFRVITRANAIVLALAKAFLTREKVDYFLNKMIEQNVPLSSYLQRHNWGAGDSMITGNIRKYQRSLIMIKSYDYANKDRIALELEARREVEHENLVKILNTVEDRIYLNYETAKKEFLDKQYVEIYCKVNELSLVGNGDDKARYYRALLSFNITGITKNNIEDAYNELNNKPSIAYKEGIIVKYKGESDDEYGL